ncbi:MAG: hypothetical protein H7329_16825 [Opitutaceae bacterium]|nr:hypothetical protein [Cytophagales bacterium]
MFKHFEMMTAWTIADFLTYIYQLVANADMQADEGEITIIKSQVEKVLITHFGIAQYSYSDCMQKIQASEGVSLLNCTDVIRRLMPTFEFRPEVKNDIFNDLQSIAISDNDFSTAEHEIINFIKQVFLTVEMPLNS